MAGACFSSAQTSAIQCPRILTYEICDYTGDDPHLWSDTKFFDKVRSKSELAEAPAELSLTIDNPCPVGVVQISYDLYLDLNGDGITETVVRSDLPTPAGFVRFKNFKSPGFSSGILTQFDKRPTVGPTSRYRFALETKNEGAALKAWVRWNTEAQPDAYIVPQLPYGRHRIAWHISDDCGNTRTCAYDMIVRDCAPPEVLCIDFLSIQMSADKQVCVDVSDMLQSVSDNYHASEGLRLGIRESYTGLGFPWDSTGADGVRKICFNCNNLGISPIELWAIDADGNADFCEIILIVEDVTGACNQDPDSVVIQIDARRENGAGAPDNLSLNIVLMGQGGGILGNVQKHAAVNNLGIATFIAPYAPIYRLLPSSLSQPANGITPVDLALISDHIQGVQLLDSPYKLIAADVNNSGGIDQDDLDVLAQYLLGSLPQDAPLYAAPWHFIPSAYFFPDPQSPWDFPNDIILPPTPNIGISTKFIGVALGDVDYSCTNCLALPGVGLRAPAPLFLALSDANVTVGQIVEITLRPDSDCYAYGWTLLHPGLRLLSASPEGAGAYWHADERSLSAVCHSGSFLTLQFQAKRAGRLSEMLSLGEGPLPALAYARSGASRPLILDFSTPAPAPTLTALANPYAEYLDLSIELPEAGMALLEVFDMAGAMLWSKAAHCEAGRHVWRVRTPGSGMRIARLRAAGASASVRVIQGR